MDGWVFVRTGFDLQLNSCLSHTDDTSSLSLSLCGESERFEHLCELEEKAPPPRLSCSDCDDIRRAWVSDSLPWRPASTTDCGFSPFHSTLLLLGAVEPSGAAEPHYRRASGLFTQRHSCGKGVSATSSCTHPYQPRIRPQQNCSFTEKHARARQPSGTDEITAHVWRFDLQTSRCQPVRMGVSVLILFLK